MNRDEFAQAVLALELREQGQTYEQIDAIFGHHDRHGNFSWKLLRKLRDELALLSSGRIPRREEP